LFIWDSSIIQAQSLSNNQAIKGGGESGKGGRFLEEIKPDNNYQTAADFVTCLRWGQTWLPSKNALH
jgi:hypothetical protein